MMRAKSLSAIALLAVVPLAACGSSKAASQATSAASAATSAASSATGGSSASQSNATPSATLPAGDKLVSAPTSKVQFAVPSNWVNFDAKLLNSAKGRELLAPLAKKAGMSVDKYMQEIMERDDMQAMSPTPVKGFSANVNAVKPQPATDLDTVADQMKAGLQKEGATVQNQTHVQTSLGEGLRTDYTLPMGSYTVTGASLVLPAPDNQMIAVTASGSSTDQTDKLSKDILASYRAA